MKQTIKILLDEYKNCFRYFINHPLAQNLLIQPLTKFDSFYPFPTLDTKDTLATGTLYIENTQSWIW